MLLNLIPTTYAELSSEMIDEEVSKMEKCVFS
jgi:hypothetical protein